MEKEKEKFRGKPCNRLGNKTAKLQKPPIVAGCILRASDVAPTYFCTADTSSDRDRSNGPRTRSGKCACSSPCTGFPLLRKTRSGTRRIPTEEDLLRRRWRGRGRRPRGETLGWEVRIASARAAEPAEGGRRGKVQCRGGRRCGGGGRGRKRGSGATRGRKARGGTFSEPGAPGTLRENPSSAREISRA